ncbi:MAG: hypothetical protein H7X89_07030 [Rhizobiales bacterium]|nr:hypothetical protein [Hyphomicrobiales bacterium]
MRLTRTKIIAFAIGLFSQPALAQPATGELTWFEVARIGDAKYARTVFVAREGAVEGGYAKYWSRVIYTVPHTISVYDNTLIAPENAKGTAQYIEMRTLHLMDCGKKTYATSKVDFHDVTGKVVSRGLFNEPPAPVESQSLQAQEAEIVCH